MLHKLLVCVCCVRYICYQYVVYAVSGLIEDMFIILQQDVDTRLLVRSFFLLFNMVHIAREGCNKNTSVNYRRKQIIRIHVKDMIHNYILLFAWFNNFFFIIIIPIWESCFISDVLIFPEQDFGFFFYLASSSGQKTSK